MSSYNHFLGSEKAMPNDRAASGGKQTPKDVNAYKPAVGPKGQSHTGPGLGGTNHGNCGTQGKR